MSVLVVAVWAAWLPLLAVYGVTWTWARRYRPLSHEHIRQISFRAGGTTGLVWGGIWSGMLTMGGDAPPLPVLLVLSVGLAITGMGLTLMALDSVREDPTDGVRPSS